MALEIGNRIARLRELRGLTQEQFAEKLGIPVISIEEIETWENAGAPDALRKIAGILQIDPNMVLIPFAAMFEKMFIITAIQYLERDSLRGVSDLLAGLVDSKRKSDGG